MGGLLKWLDLIDYCHYMTPMNALPPTPQLWGDGLAGRVDPPVRDVRAVAADLDGASALGRLLGPGHDPAGVRADPVPDDDRRRLGRRLPQQHVPDDRGAGPGRRPAPAAGRAVGAHGGRRRRCPGRGSTWSARWPGGGTGTCAASTTASTTSRSRPGSSASRPARRPPWTPSTATGAPTTGRRAPLRRSGSRSTGRPPYVVRPDIGTAAWISCAGHLPYGQSLDQRADDDRSLTWDVADGRAGGSGDRRTPGPAAARGQLGAGGDRGGPALRRLPGRHLGAGDARHAQPDPAATGSARPSRWSRGRSTTSRWSSRRRRGAGCRASGCGWPCSGADWPNTVAPPRPADPEVLDGAISSAGAAPRLGPPADRRWPPAATRRRARPKGVTWRIEDDVLAGVTRAVIDHGGEYPTPYGGYREHYSGQVEVDRKTFAQRATAPGVASGWT